MSDDIRQSIGAKLAAIEQSMNAITGSFTFTRNGITVGERVVQRYVPEQKGTVIRCDSDGVSVLWDDGQRGELDWDHRVLYNAYHLVTVRS